MSDTLLSIFSDVLNVPAEKLNDDSGPNNLPQWDSLAAMNLVVALEEKFNVRLSTRDIMKMSSIGLARKTLLEKNVKL